MINIDRELSIDSINLRYALRRNGNRMQKCVINFYKPIVIEFRKDREIFVVNLRRSTSHRIFASSSYQIYHRLESYEFVVYKILVERRKVFTWLNRIRILWTRGIYRDWDRIVFTEKDNLLKYHQCTTFQNILFKREFVSSEYDYSSFCNKVESLVS